MKKIYSFAAMALTAQALFAAYDYVPNPPSDVEYLTHRIQSRTLYDANKDKVSYEGEYSYALNEWGEFRVENPIQGKISFYVTNTYADGHTGNAPNKNMYFRILIRRTGQTQEEAQPLIFDAASGYIKWEQNPSWEPMEWVKNDFTDAYDLGLSNGVDSEPSFHSIGFYYDPAEIVQIGVQSRYVRSKKDYDSEITWVDPTQPDTSDCLTWDQWLALAREYNPDYENPFEGKEVITGVEEVKAEAVATEYYDLQGNRLVAGQNGLQIKLTRMSDGSVKATKVIR